MEFYLQTHLDRGQYLPRPLRIPDTTPYENSRGWKDYALAPGLIFSHRKNRFMKSTFTEVPHIHDFYEVLIPCIGFVDYVCENSVVSPVFPSVVWFRPGQQHTGRLRKECDYERYVFYFRPEVFDWEGMDCSLLNFTRRTDGFSLCLPDPQFRQVLDLLSSLREECSSDRPNLLLCKALFIQIFALIDRAGTPETAPEALPERAVEVREYIDANFREISSVSDLAARFFYSREHLTRLFRRSYNISVSAYLIRCRLRAGVEALQSGATVTQAAFDSGFDSLSAFTSAFRKQYGVPPSEYIKK